MRQDSLNENLNRVFKYFDSNGDDKISPAELLSCMRASVHDMTAEEVEAALSLADSDGDGLLGPEDFVRLVGSEEERRKSLREAFGVYEMEGEGCITPKSLKRALRRLGETRSTEELLHGVKGIPIFTISITSQQTIDLSIAKKCYCILLMH